MPASNPNQELKKLRKRFPKLTPAEIQRVTGYDSYGVVYGWTVPKSNKNYRKMPARALRLLMLELGLAKPQFRSLTK